MLGPVKMAYTAQLHTGFQGSTGVPALRRGYLLRGSSREPVCLHVPSLGGGSICKPMPQASCWQWHDWDLIPNPNSHASCIACAVAGSMIV